MNIHFATGMFPHQKQYIFLEQKFLAFNESPCKLKNFRTIHIFFAKTITSLLTVKYWKGKGSQGVWKLRVVRVTDNKMYQNVKLVENAAPY